MIKNILIGVGVTVAIVLGLFGVNKPAQVVVKEVPSAPSYGAISSPDVGTYMTVGGYFQQAGGVNATSSTDTTEVITFADMSIYNILDITPNLAAATYTLPATTTFPLGQNAGAYRSWVIRNATSTAGATITVAAGTGIDLQEPDGQNVVIAGGGNFAWLTCYRKAAVNGAGAGDIVCLVDESIPAD